MPNQDQLIKALNQCQNKNILVIGDIMLDEYHWCQVGRISPEAPVPVCKVINTSLIPGGAANVATNINALNNDSFLLGVIGQDSSGDKLLNVLKDNQINTSQIIQDPEKPTILKSRVIAHQQHVVRVDRENSLPISKKIRNKLYSELITFLPNIDAIIISDYLKGTLPDSFVKKIISLANKANCPVIIDPKGDHYQKYKGASALTPNKHEFETCIKKKMLKEEDYYAEGQKLLKKLDLDLLIITRSEKGMTVITKDSQKIDIPTKAKEVYDITGAGDTVISMLAIALAAKIDIRLAAYLANYAAGIVVGKIGTSCASIQEISQAILEDLSSKTSVST
jgi:D-beta-D-heptose 7-phosphate kinase/D-beta-D-heptose 1-phosphate adenosyltransferase